MEEIWGKYRQKFEGDQEKFEYELVEFRRE